MSRLMPKQDPKTVLLRDPSWLLRVERGTKRLGPHPDDICMPPAPTSKHLSLQALGLGTLSHMPDFSCASSLYITAVEGQSGRGWSWT